MLEGKYLLFGDCYDDIIKVRKQCTSTNVDDLMDNEAIHVIVYEDKQPIACGRMLLQDNRYIFDDIYVIEERRRNKIGDFTVRLLIEKANLMCAKEIIVCCDNSNKKFFEYIGFKEVKEPLIISMDGLETEMHLNLETFFKQKKCCK